MKLLNLKTTAYHSWELNKGNLFGFYNYRRNTVIKINSSIYYNHLQLRLRSIEPYVHYPQATYSFKLFYRPLLNKVKNEITKI